MNIISLRFDDSNIYGIDNNGIEHSQPLRFYPRLQRASTKERNDYARSTIGFHWANLNEDLSFESFYYNFDDDQLVLHEDEAPYNA